MLPLAKEVPHPIQDSVPEGSQQKLLFEVFLESSIFETLEGFRVLVLHDSVDSFVDGGSSMVLSFSYSFINGLFEMLYLLEARRYVKIRHSFDKLENSIAQETLNLEAPLPTLE